MLARRIWFIAIIYRNLQCVAKFSLYEYENRISISNEKTWFLKLTITLATENIYKNMKNYRLDSLY